MSKEELKSLAKKTFPDPITGHWYDPEDFRFRTKKARTLRRQFIKNTKSQIN